MQCWQMIFGEDLSILLSQGVLGEKELPVSRTYKKGVMEILDSA